MKKIIFLFLLTLFCLCGLSSNQNLVYASDKLIITFDFNYESIDKALYNTLQNKQSIVQKEYLFNEQIEFPDVDPDLNDFYQYYWTLNGQKVNEFSQVASSNVTYKLKTSPRKYTIYYVLSDKEQTETLNYKETETYSIENEIHFYIPQRPNYYFIDWYLTRTLTEGQAKMQTTKFDRGDIILYPKWIPIEFEINYHTDAENLYNLPSYNVETQTFELQPISKHGYIFKGWFYDEKYSVPATRIAKGTVGQINLYPKWDLQKYVVTYILPDGSTEKYLVKYGQSADKPNLKSNMFNILTYSKSTQNITDDTTIVIKYHNIWYVYVLGLALIVGITLGLIYSANKRKKKIQNLRMIYASKRQNKRRLFK